MVRKVHTPVAARLGVTESFCVCVVTASETGWAPEQGSPAVRTHLSPTSSHTRGNCDPRRKTCHTCNMLSEQDGLMVMMMIMMEMDSHGGLEVTIRQTE